MNSPVRPLRTSRRALTGRVALSEGRSAAFESSLERDWLIVLDFDPRVVQIAVQPFFLTHVVDGTRRRYTPDVLVEFVDSGKPRTVVYEVKPHDDLREQWTLFRPRFMAANAHCRERGWRFEIVTEREIRTPSLENAKFLRRYRTMDVSPLQCMQLIAMLQVLGPTTPQTLIATTFSTVEARMSGVATMWHLIATRRIAAHLDQPLTMTSAIAFPGDL